MNQYETEALSEIFAEHGFETVSNSEMADVILINSCTVTAESDRKTRQAVRRFRAKNKNAVIVLTGCMAEAFPEDAAQIDDADIIVGNTDLDKIYSLVDDFLKNKKRIIEVNKHENGECFNTRSIKGFSEHTRAFMKIQDGCDKYCTYCIIPTARGPIRSKPIEEIRAEAEALAKAGFLEVVLVGINLSSFGVDSDSTLADAVEAVSSVKGIKRVRLGSIEPDLITDGTLDALSQNKKFCPQFHLSLQSGSDKTLKRMNRHYDSAFYYDLVKRIRGRFENPSITTDIMVGFAGEDNKEFEQSLNFVQKIGFARSHIFAYSRRKGTMAYNMPNQVTNAQKSERSRRMIALTDKTEIEFLESQIGKTAEVLFETKQEGKYFGYTENYTGVFVQSQTDLCGTIQRVKIIGVEDKNCIGEIIVADTK